MFNVKVKLFVLKNILFIKGNKLINFIFVVVFIKIVIFNDVFV